MAQGLICLDLLWHVRKGVHSLQARQNVDTNLKSDGQPGQIDRRKEVLKRKQPLPFVAPASAAQVPHNQSSKKFAFTPFTGRFDWKVLHGVDVDEIVSM